MFKNANYFLLFFFFLIATGCAHTSVLTRAGETFKKEAADRILLMPPDIELYEMTMGGMMEPKADWTASALKNVTEAIRQELKAHHDTMISYKEAPDGSSEFKDHQQLIKLHEIVGASIMKHQYPTLWQLPTKEDNFEWTLGQRTTRLKEKYRAQYGLFVYMRDSYASAGRVGLMIGMAVLGVGIPLGQQTGFASLVDLQTGDIVWFNRMVSGAGDLRELNLARSSVQNLLEDFPL